MFLSKIHITGKIEKSKWYQPMRIIVCMLKTLIQKNLKHVLIGKISLVIGINCLKPLANNETDILHLWQDSPKV